MDNHFQEFLEMDDPLYTTFKMDNPLYEFSKMDGPPQESSEMKASFGETTITTQQEPGVEDEPRDENARAQKKRARQSQAVKEGRKVLARLPFFEDLSKQAGNQKPDTIFESLVRRVRDAQWAANNPEDETDFEIMSEEEREELGPWISRNKLKTRYRSGDARPWYPKLPGLSTKAKPKRAPIIPPKPSQPAQTDPPKRGRGRPRKYALDDPRSSLYRANRRKNGIRQGKKAARDFPIHDDNEGTNGINLASKHGGPAANANGVFQSSKPGRSAARLPLTRRGNFQLPKRVGKSRNYPLATSGVRGGDSRGSRGQGFETSRSRPKSHFEIPSQDVGPDASGDASSSFGASPSPPPPGGGGKSVRRPSVEANFYPGMCPSEREIRDDMAHLDSLSLPCFQDGSTETLSPSIPADPFWQTLKYNQEYYHEGGYMKDQSR